MVLAGVDVLGEGVVEVVVVEMVVLGLVEKVVEVMEWLARLCLPRTRNCWVLAIHSCLCLSMAGSPGLPSLSLMSRPGNTGVSVGD